MNTDNNNFSFTINRLSEGFSALNVAYRQERHLTMILSSSVPDFVRMGEVSLGRISAQTHRIIPVRVNLPQPGKVGYGAGELDAVDIVAGSMFVRGGVGWDSGLSGEDLSNSTSRDVSSMPQTDESANTLSGIGYNAHSQFDPNGLNAAMQITNSTALKRDGVNLDRVCTAFSSNGGLAPIVHSRTNGVNGVVHTFNDIWQPRPVVYEGGNIAIDYEDPASGFWGAPFGDDNAIAPQTLALPRQSSAPQTGVFEKKDISIVYAVVPAHITGFKCSYVADQTGDLKYQRISLDIWAAVVNASTSDNLTETSRVYRSHLLTSDEAEFLYNDGIHQDAIVERWLHGLGLIHGGVQASASDVRSQILAEEASGKTVQTRLDEAKLAQTWTRLIDVPRITWSNLIPSQGIPNDIHVSPAAQPSDDLSAYDQLAIIAASPVQTILDEYKRTLQSDNLTSDAEPVVGMHPYLDAYSVISALLFTDNEAIGKSLGIAFKTNSAPLTKLSWEVKSDDISRVEDCHDKLKTQVDEFKLEGSTSANNKSTHIAPRGSHGYRPPVYMADATARELFWRQSILSANQIDDYRFSWNSSYLDIMRLFSLSAQTYRFIVYPNQYSEYQINWYDFRAVIHP